MRKTGSGYCFLSIRILEIGAPLNLLFHNLADFVLELLQEFESLKILAVMNCKLAVTKDYFGNFWNLEKLYLWQCHPNLVECAKKSGKSDFTLEVKPSSPLSEILMTCNRLIFPSGVVLLSPPVADSYVKGVRCLLSL